MRFLKLLRQDIIKPYTLRDLNKRPRTIDYWISVLGGVFLALGIGVTVATFYADSQVRPRVAFDKGDWRVSFDITSGCEIASQAKADCPANPENHLLWQSDIRRNSDKFLERFRTSKSEAFWLGLRVPTEKLKLAAKSSATTLVLPKLNGTVQVWVDGVYQMTHDFSQERMPLQLSLPKSRLLQDHELVIALGVFPYPHQPVPESAAESSDGFFTALDADRLTRSTVFFSTSVHLIAVGLFLLVAGFLWSVSGTGRTRDYSVGTQLALLISLVSLLSVDLSFRVFNVATYESIYFSLLMIEAILVARFTWTILRSSRGTSRIEIAMILACLIGPSLFNFYRWIEAVGVNLMTSWVLPLTYLACAASIGIRFVRVSKRGSVTSSTRRQFLTLTGLSTAVTGIAYLVESRHQSGFHVVWSRWINFIILFGLVRVFTKSHQTKSSLIELSPSSMYHKLENPPEQVDGWLLLLDVLKFSSDRQVMSTILSHLWTITQLNDGVVIKADEGSLLVLFGKSQTGSEDLRMAKALTEMAKCLKDLEQRLPIVFPSQQYSTSILFRGAALKGSIKPSWHSGETGLSHIPIWLDVGSQGSMQAVKDLLATDLDAVLRSHDSSIVVIKTEDAESLMQRGFVSLGSRVDLATDNIVAFIASRILKQAPGSGSKAG